MTKEKKFSRMNEKLEIASQCIKPDQEPKVLSNDFLKQYFTDIGISISSNDMVILRRSLPFTKEMIIPVREEHKGLRKEKMPMAFIKFAKKEDYDSYDLTERNFRALTQEEVDYVKDQLAENEIRDTRMVLKFLTVCDSIVTQIGRGTFIPLKKCPLMAYIRESMKTIEMILSMLKRIHVLSQKGDLYRWNTENQRDEAESLSADFNSEIVDNLEEYDKMKNTGEEPEEQMNSDVLDEGTAIIKQMFVFIQKQKKALEHVEELKQTLYSMKQENEELKKQLSALKIVEREYKRLTTDNQKLQRNINQYADNIKDYKAFKKVVQNRVENTMDQFSLKLDQALQDFRTTHNEARFVRIINGLSSDTVTTVVNMVATMKQ